MRRKHNATTLIITVFVIVYFIAISLAIKAIVFNDTIETKEEDNIIEQSGNNENDLNPVVEEIQPEIEKEKHYIIKIDDEGDIIYNPGSSSGYNYGPSIIINEDGSMDAWFSSPGNNGTQWDWIRYRHSDDGINWSPSEVVLTPTIGSWDSCSACDPGVVFFNDYYYLAYTSTFDSGRNGLNNSAFVARSKYPNGPFEKWNGSGWGGSPVPIIKYEGDPDGWGIGEVSFVIKDDDLFIYTTHIDATMAYVELRKADLVDDWPATIRYKNMVCFRPENDSLDVAYIEDLDMFFAFSINYRMQEKSDLILLISKNGKEFELADENKNYIEDYAHNLGVGKTKEGHINNTEDILIGYAFGKQWGQWATIMQHISIIEEEE